jgi:hypothetical protein
MHAGDAATRLPVDELPDLGLQVVWLTDDREDLDRFSDEAHSVFVLADRTQEVGEVVQDRRLMVAVAMGAAKT